jgi:hypothetical protein
MILAHKEDSSKEGFPGQLIFKSERRVCDNINAEEFLHPGTYMIYALTLAKTAEGVVQLGGIVIHRYFTIYIFPFKARIVEGKIMQLLPFINICV